MANEKVSFVYGLQSNLPTGNSIVNGRFYITTDSQKLYLGLQGKLLDLDNGVMTYENDTAANADKTGRWDGELAYIKSGHKIVAFNSTSNSWEQVNPDHNDNDNTYLTNWSGDTWNDSSDNKTKSNLEIITDNDEKYLAFTFYGREATSHVTGADTYLDRSTRARVKLSDISSAIMGDAAVGLEIANTNASSAEIQTTGSGKDTSKTVKIVGTNAVTVSSNAANDTITINVNNPSVYRVEKTNATLVSNLDGSASNIVTFANGTGLTLSNTADTITYDHKAKPTSGTAAANSNENKTLSNSNSISVVSDVYLDTFGHVANVHKFNLNIPDYPVVNESNYISSIAYANQRLEWENADGSSGNTPLYVNAKLGNGNNETQYLNGTTNIATTNYVDSKMKLGNAMVFKGTIGPTGANVSSLPTSNVSIGDVYVVKTAGTYNSENCKVGDFFIATGDEDDSGIITSNLGWQYVPAGDETVLQYHLSDLTYVNSAAVNIPLSDGSATTNTTFKVDDTWLKFASDGVLQHQGPSTAQSRPTTTNNKTQLEFGGYFYADEITKDSKGHVVSITNNRYQLPNAPVQTSITVNAHDSQFDIEKDGATIGTIKTSSGNKISDASAYTTSNSTAIIKFNHATTTPTTANAETIALSFGSTVDFATLFTDNDSYGHVNVKTPYKISLPSLPAADTYSHTIDGASSVTGNNVSTTNSYVNHKFNKNGAAIETWKIQSNTLAITTSSNVTTVDLIWGSF